MKVTPQRSFRDWLRATRYWSLSASLLPSLALILSWCCGCLPLRAFGVSAVRFSILSALSLITIAFLHLGTNVLSDCKDTETGVDGPDALNGVDWLAKGIFRIDELRRFAFVLVSLGIACGIVVASLSSPFCLLVGAAGAFIALCYSTLKRHALGDLAVFLCFFCLPSIGLGLACLGRFSFLDIPILLPSGVMPLAILHANNARDRETDRQANCLTLAQRLSERSSQRLFAIELFAPYAITALLMLCRLLPYASLGVFLTLPSAIEEWGAFRAGDLTARDRCVARLQFAFASLYALAFPVSLFGVWVQLSIAACLVFRASGFVPRASCFVPRASCFVPRASCFVPRASCFVPRAWVLVRVLLLSFFLAAVLWGVFYLGNIVSRTLLPFAGEQIASIYAIRSGASPFLAGCLLLFLIGPAEELFWRGFLQRRLGERLGPNAGFVIASAAYTLVHVFSLNFMLIGAAGVCGIYWGLLYRFFPRHLPAIVLSHAFWDVAVFLIFPIE